MGCKYVGVWGVFEEDFAEGLDRAFSRYRQAGIKHVMYGGVAHLFDVNREFYTETCIDPHIQIDYENNVGDVFGTKSNLISSDYKDVCALAERYSLSLDFDITPGVSEPIVQAYPHTAVVDVEGKASPHWLCPSNPDVINYFYGRTKDILIHNPEIGEVELDVVSMDFYDPQVVPDWVLPELSPIRQLAAGNCFCKHCTAKAKNAGLDVESMKAEIAPLYKEAIALTYENFKNLYDSYRGMFDIVRFLLKHPALLNWLNFRAQAVNDFVAGMYRMVKQIRPDVLVSNDLVAPSFSWTLGQLYHVQPDITDLTKLMLYHKTIGSYEVKPLRRVQQAVPQIDEKELLEQYYCLKSFSGPKTFAEFASQGIDVENLYYEVRKAKLEAGTRHMVVAGLVADPPATADDVREAVRMAHKAGANGYMLHLWYGNAPKENIEAFGEQLRELGEI